MVAIEISKFRLMTVATCTGNTIFFFKVCVRLLPMDAFADCQVYNLICLKILHCEDKNSMCGSPRVDRYTAKTEVVISPFEVGNLHSAPLPPWWFEVKSSVTGVKYPLE